MRVLFLSLSAVLSACAPHVRPAAVAPDADADLSTCGAMDTPADLVAMAEEAAPLMLPLVRDLHFRRGWLVRHDGPVAHLAGRLAPLDLILVSARNNSAGLVSRGYLTHAALYLGTEAQLRAAGWWDDPGIRPHQGAIRAGRMVIEANGLPVALSTLAEALDADGAAVLRPTALAPGEGRRAVADALAHLGQPFDNRFDADDDSHLFCTELIDHVLPGASLPRLVLYGRATILPDDIARGALDGSAPLAYVTFLHADRRGWAVGTEALLRTTIAANWSPP